MESKTSPNKTFTSADMLKPTSQPNSANYENIATFTSPTLYSIPATVPHEVDPQYNFNSSVSSPYRYSFSLYMPQTMNYGINVIPYSTAGNTLEAIYNEDLIQSSKSSSEKKGKKGKKEKGNKVQMSHFNENPYMNNNNNSILTVLPQCLSNNSLLSLTSTASSSIQEMDFSNVRNHYDSPKKKSKSKKGKKEKQSKELNSQIGKSTLSQVHQIQDINNNNEISSGENTPDYSLIDMMFNSDKDLSQTINNKKLSDEQIASVNNKNNEGSNTSLVGYMFNDDMHSNTSLVGYIFSSNNSLNHS